MSQIYKNFKINLKSLRKTIEIFPKIIDSFTIIYDYLDEELSKDPNKQESLRKLSYNIHKCIDPNAKQAEYEKMFVGFSLLGALAGKTEEGIFLGLLAALSEMTKDSGNPDIAKKLLKQKITDGIENKMILRLCYVQQITILEVYLRDTISTALKNNKGIFNRFIKQYSKVANKKFKAEMFIEFKDNILKEYILNNVFHQLSKDTRSMYLAAFDIDLMKYKKKNDILKIVLKRHNIIHRNSMGIAGKKIIIKKTDIDNSLKAVEQFVNYIEKQLNDKGLGYITKSSSRSQGVESTEGKS